MPMKVEVERLSCLEGVPTTIKERLRVTTGEIIELSRFIRQPSCLQVSVPVGFEMKHGGRGASVDVKGLTTLIRRLQSHRDALIRAEAEVKVESKGKKKK
jgi:hypothetical protein